MITEHMENISYPDFTGIEGLTPRFFGTSRWDAGYWTVKAQKIVQIDEKLYGSSIYWQVKEDGENTGVYLDENGELQVRTRHTVKVAEDIRQRFLNLPCSENIKKMLAFIEKNRPGTDVVLFGEFMVKGKSPKRIAVRDENSFKAFDLWSSDFKTNPPLLRADSLIDLCNFWKIPIVEQVEITTVNSLEELLAVRERLLAKCRENRWEGVVGKVWVTNENGSFVNFVKEKTDIPRVASKPRPGDELPILPDTEITGAIEKAFFTLGLEKFSQIDVAMPMISKLVKEQCVKHKCRSPQNVCNLYRERLMRL